MPVRLRPLPHEFGLRINIVPKFMSVLWIAGWEFSNTWRAKMKALREGKIVVASRVSVKLQFVGSTAIGVGGKSQVVTFSVEKLPEAVQGTSEAKASVFSKVNQEFLSKLNREVSSKPNRESQPFNSNTPKSFGDVMVQNQDAWLDFTITLGRLEDPVSRSEALRLFMLFASGVISENQFRTRLRELRITGGFSLRV